MTLNIPSGWQITSLKRLEEKASIFIKDGDWIESKDQDENGSIRLLQLADIGEGRFVNSSSKFINEETAKKLKVTFLKEGDLLIARMPDPIGRTCVLPNLDRKCITAVDVTILRNLDDNLIGSYLMHTFNSEYFLRKVFSMRTGTTRPRISRTNLMAIEFGLPTNNEQKQISKILNDVIDLILKTEDLISKKILLKKALMQQLLTGKKRFPEFNKVEWKEYELKKVLSSVKRPVPRPDKKYTALSIRSHGKGTFLREVENPQEIMMDELYEVKENDLIVNITFGWEGAIAIVKKSDEGALVSHRFPTFTINPEYAIPDYLKYLIIQRRFIYNLAVISPGGAGRNRVLDKKDFLKLKVFLPGIDEQKKIASLLKSVDEEISLLQTKLELIKTQKKGLMQKLLTGQIRV